MEADDGVDRDRPRVGLLAHDLPVHLALGRHVDHGVVGDEGGAAEATPLGEAAVAAYASSVVVAGVSARPCT